MACKIIHSWTFSGLVGAFLDLAIAYLLLIAAAVAYFTSRFLDFFGLSLPCPCDGLFGNPKNNYCIHRQLVDGPSEKTGTVQFQLKSKFPFDSLWTEDPHFHSKSKPVKEVKHDDAHFEFEGEASCSSLSDGKWLDVLGRDSVSGNEQSIESGAVNLESGKEKCFHHKGKKNASRRPSHSLRHCRRGASVDCGKLFSVSSCDMAQSDSQDIATPPYIISKTGNDDSEFTSNTGRRSPTLRRGRKGSSIDYGMLYPVSSYDMLQSDGRYNPTPPSSISKIRNEVPSSSEDCTEAPTDTGVTERVLCLELNKLVGETTPIEDDASSVEDFRYNTQEKIVYDSNDKTTVRVLEQVLDEEHAARNALYYELEKERSAAATAADEAMAMILRLQEEKASIEMESRQYQRMIEEKSAYDAEEMNILKEILVRREREKYFLEKEVEYYRQMLFGNQGDVEMHDVSTTQALSISLHSSEEMVLRPERTMDSMAEKPKELPGSDLEYDTDSSNYLLPCINSKYEINNDFQEKGMVSTVERPVSRGQEVQVMNPEGLSLHDETSSAFNSEPCVHDVHVIDDDSHTCDETSAEKSEQLPKSAPLDISEKHNTTAGLGTERKIHRASSDAARESPRMNRSQVKFLPHNVRRNSMSAVDLEKWYTENKVHRVSSDTETTDVRRNSMTALDCERWKKARNIDRASSDPSPSPSAMRRNSMSAVDHERWKLDNEVEWLRERLRIVQEGREKLNFSVGHNEREKVQRKLLENITSQLREIRQLTEPGKAECQASLPPPSAKVMSKKRRWRTLSLGVHRST